MIGFLRYFAAVAGTVLAVFAAGVVKLRNPHDQVLVLFLEFAIPAAVLLGWVAWGCLKEACNDLGLKREHLQRLLNYIRCLFAHDWDGCRCTRCKTVRDKNHFWDGCQCTKCNAERDEYHIWKIRKCRQVCERCGSYGDEVHTWDGCRCTECETTRHEWQQGQCTRCGISCQHPEVTYEWKVVETEATTQAVKFRICKVCQMQVSVMCQTAPRKIASPDSVNEPRRTIPSSDDMANDPLWQELKGCWKILLQRDRRSYDWQDRDSELYPYKPPRLIQTHDEVLKVLVKFKQLEPVIADGIRRTFIETYYHIVRSMATCYMRSPPEREWRADLLLQLQTLYEMAERCEIQSEIVERVRTRIEGKIDLLRQTRSTDPPPWQNQALASGWKESEAARVIVALLLNSHNPS